MPPRRLRLGYYQPVTAFACGVSSVHDARVSIQSPVPTDKMSPVIIYTDGACRGNPGPGGWGVVLRSGPHEKELRGSELNTTNNRMELTAAIQALAALKRPCHVRLYTDSEYVRKGITEWLPQWKARNWRTADKKPVKNIDLWQALEREIERHTIEWHWVKGHAGNADNERADRLANEAIDEMLANRASEEP
jgi:ribonuclease HI